VGVVAGLFFFVATTGKKRARVRRS